MFQLVLGFDLGIPSIFNACNNTSTVADTSVDKAEGRRKGASAPMSTAVWAMATLSVLTITCSKTLDFKADSIDHAIKGFPAISKRFFPGRRLLPPLAGIIAIYLFASAIEILFIIGFSSLEIFWFSNVSPVLPYWK